MKRIPEPAELMDDPAQARAYAEADFEAPHAAFINELLRLYPDAQPLHILEPGCGSGDISWRLARCYPNTHIDAIDGAPAMLDIARELFRDKGCAKQVHTLQHMLPCDELPSAHYDAVITNAVLHHLLEPAVLWQTIKLTAKPGAIVFVMDLARPENKQTAAEIVAREAADEAEVLKTDFYHSLLAAYTPAEIREQLAHAGLKHLHVTEPSENHLLIHGRL